MGAIVTPSRALRGFDRPYRPPAGYSDFPFTWVFDATSLTPGQNYPNQFVTVQSGYGDFILRRIMGLDTVLAHGSGQFQMKDMSGRYFQSLPQNVGQSAGSNSLVGCAADIAILPERRYKELSNIGFDLYDIGAGAANKALQIGFQGVRRIQSSPPPEFTYRPKTYSYVTYSALLGGTASSPTLTTQVIQPVLNYDFDLMQIYLFFQQLLAFITDSTASLFFTPTLPLAAPPELVTIQITAPVGNNLPLTVTVNGYAIVVQPATNGIGQIVSTGNDVANAINSNPQSAAFVFATSVYPTEPLQTRTPAGVGPVPVVSVEFLSANTSWAECLLFDQNSVQVYSQAMLDLFVNAGSYYKNGAVVPPLHYAQNSRIRMDITPTIFVGLETGSSPLWATIHYVGRQRIPC